MGARLLCKTGKLEGLEFSLGEETTVGRRRSSDAVVDAPGVSGTHATIRWSEEGGRYELEDLGSTNGTLLDGVPAQGIEPLGTLHVITFGRHHSFIFVWDGATPTGTTSAEEE